MLREWFNIIASASITLPMLEMGLMTLTIAICLVSRLNRTGLIVAYLFAYRWGWPFFQGQSNAFMMAYFWFGCAVGILTVVGMLQSAHSGSD